MAELTEKIGKYKTELTEELKNILRYWSDRTPDELHGGFFGRVDNNSRIIAGAFSERFGFKCAHLMDFFQRPSIMRLMPITWQWLTGAYDYICLVSSRP